MSQTFFDQLFILNSLIADMNYHLSENRVQHCRALIDETHHYIDNMKLMFEI